jgi:hypothetical protein
MTKFSRKGTMIRVRSSEFEISILVSLVQQVAGLLEGDARSAPEDPFARWQAEMSDAELDFSDPVLARLFPEAIPADQVASGEFRRLTAGRQRAERLSNAGIVLDELKDNDEGMLEIPVAHLDAWLKTVTSVRLSLAVRLGIETADDLQELEDLPESDPRTFVYNIYEWLAFFSEALLAAA